MPTLSVNTQFGRLDVTAQDDAITKLVWASAVDSVEDGLGDGETTPLLQEAAAQLRAYDKGQLHVFDLPLKVLGSAFQRAVCDAMLAIPYGDTCTYGDIAKALDHPAQAVGGACGGNPIPIIIPCHRVMGAGGKLTGFSGAGGVETKVALLIHESAGGLLI